MYTGILRRCTRCGELQHPSDFSPDRRQKSGLQSWCKKCCNEKTRNIYKKLRKDILKKLGGAFCVRCGFDDERALHIDHIHGGGFKELNKAGNRKAYYNMRNMSDEEANSKYQVLCANCNFIKKHENREFANLKKK